MKRLPAFIGICFLCTLAAASFLGRAVSLFLAGACAALLLAALLLPRLRGIRVLQAAAVTVLCGFLFFALFDLWQAQPLAAYDGTKAQVVCTVQSVEQNEPAQQIYTVRVRQVAFDGQPVKETDFLARLSFYDGPALQVCDTLQAQVRFFLPQGGTGFTVKAAYAAKGIHLFAVADSYKAYTVTPAQSLSLHGKLESLRARLLQTARSLLPGNEGELLCAVLLGDDSGLSESVQMAFRQAGVSHLLVVSGIHMATIAQMVFLLLGMRKGRVRWFGAVPAAVLLVLYMAVVGFSPSVVRSGVMCLLLLVSGLVGRQYDAWNALGIAALAVCLCNPFAGGSVGMLLSFAAVAGILTLCGPLQRKLLCFVPVPKSGWFCKAAYRLYRWAAVGIAASVSATVFTLPIMLLAFDEVSLLAPVSTLLLILPATLLLQAGLPAVLLGSLPGFWVLARPFAFVCGICAKVMTFVVQWLSKLLPQSMACKKEYMLLVLAAMLFLAALARLLAVNGKDGRRLYRVCAVLCTALLVSSYASYTALHKGSIKLVLVGGETCTALAVQGSAAGILCWEETSDYALKNSLSANGIRTLEFANITCDKATALSNLTKISEKRQVKHLYTLDGLYVPKALTDRTQSLQYYTQYADFTAFGAVFRCSEAGVWVQAYGVTVFVQRQPCQVQCDYLLTADPASACTAGYVLLCRQQQEPLPQVTVAARAYTFTTGQNLYLEIFPDGHTVVGTE